MSTRRNPSILLTACATAAGIAATAPAIPASPGMTYESLEDLPDFAGSWTPLTPPFVLPPVAAQATPVGAPGNAPNAVIDRACVGPRVPAGARPDATAACRAFIQERIASGNGDRDFCEKRAFIGQPSAGAGGSIEILFTPGQVTLSVESGLVRRIYLRAEPPAGALDESTSGTSIGRWDGQTLVVETTGLDPNATFIPGVPLGKNARVHERIALKDHDTLQIEATITAPSVLTAPTVSRMEYRRARDRVFTAFDTCVDGDRSVDRRSGQDQFDATPPDDLPPPPAN